MQHKNPLLFNFITQHPLTREKNMHTHITHSFTMKKEHQEIRKKKEEKNYNETVNKILLIKNIPLGY